MGTEKDLKSVSVKTYHYAGPLSFRRYVKLWVSSWSSSTPAHFS